MSSFLPLRDSDLLSWRFESFIGADLLFQLWAQRFESFYEGFKSFFSIFFACILHLRIQILEFEDSNLSTEYWILGALSEVFALRFKCTSEILNNLISKHIKSILVSSKSMRDQPWFNIMALEEPKVIYNFCKSNSYSKMSLKCLEKDQIQILEFWIRIPILERLLNNEKVKFGLWIRISKGWIRIPSVKFQTEAIICTLTKKGIFVHVMDIF